MTQKVEVFFDTVTSTLSYIVYDENTGDCVVIDPVLNYEAASSRISKESINKIFSFIDSKGLNVHYILETHAHADHLTGAMQIKEKIPTAKIAIGMNITKVQKLFSELYNFKDFKSDGSQFDLLLRDDEVLKAGSLEIKVIFTPGHTPACSSYLIEDMVFTGDALFMPDSGTGRCDFPAGDAGQLYDSIHNKLYALPDSTKVFTAHDYQPNGRSLEYESTIGKSKTHNIQLKSTTSKMEFTEFRMQRDKTLAAPQLLLPSLQVNIDAGKLPNKEDNGQRYLRIPLRD